MNTGFVNIHGQPIARFASHPQPIKARKEAPAEYHKGWIVEGHRQGTMEEARKAALQAIADWERAKPEDKTGKKPPPPWNESHWRQNSRFTRIRQKPFEIPEAAQQLKAMAEKAGWEDVRVTELAKRKA